MRVSAILIATALTTTLAVAQTFPNGLYYRFNEGAGTATQNLANPQVGTAFGNFVGSPTWTAGQFGTAYANTGVATNYVDSGWPVNFTNTSWTLEYWVSLNSITTTISYMCGDTSTGFRTFSGGVAGSNGIILRGTGITDCWINPAVSAAATWAHVAWVYDNSVTPKVIYGYLNGVLAVTSVQATPITVTSANNFRVGAQTTATALNGSMDEFRLWFVARSAADIIANYNLEVNDRNILNVTTTGAGTGDLAVSLTNIDPNAVEGYLLISATPPAIVGTGPLLGLNPDGLTWSIFSIPSFPGNPLHFPIGFVGFFPDVPFTVGAGGGAVFAGQTWDFAAAVLGTGVTYLGRSGVKRITW